MALGHTYAAAASETQRCTTPSGGNCALRRCMHTLRSGGRQARNNTCYAFISAGRPGFLFLHLAIVGRFAVIWREQHQNRCGDISIASEDKHKT